MHTVKLLKFCSGCGIERHRRSFSVRKASPDGLCYRCKECSKEYIDTWRQKNPEAYKKWAAKNKSSLQKKGVEYRKEHREELRIRLKNWSVEHRDLTNARVARRTAIKMRANVRWASKEEIRKFYSLAAIMSDYTGVKYEVDHIYPLQGKRSCGLHCEDNLQILTKEANIRKLNHEPEGLNG